MSGKSSLYSRSICLATMRSLFHYRKLVYQVILLSCMFSISVYVASLQIRKIMEIQRTHTEAMVDILDAAKLYKHTYEYEVYRQRLNGQLQSIKRLEKNVSTAQKKSHFILLDDIVFKLYAKYKLIVMVFSHSQNFQRRALVRQLWGNSSVWRTNERFKVIFLLGGIDDTPDLKRIYYEAKLHRDIIMESVPEGYYTTSSKLGIGLHWITLQTSLKYDFVLKCDDDVFVHMDNVMKTITSEEYKEAHFFGRLTEKPHPLREGRYKITKVEYPSDKYPPFHSGAGVFLSKLLLQRIAPYFDFVNPMKLEDVYLAWLVEKFGRGIKAIDCKGYSLYNFECSYDGQLLFTHPVKTAKCMRDLSRSAVREMI